MQQKVLFISCSQKAPFFIPKNFLDLALMLFTSRQPLHIQLYNQPDNQQVKTFHCSTTHTQQSNLTDVVQQISKYKGNTLNPRTVPSFALSLVIIQTIIILILIITKATENTFKDYFVYKVNIILYTHIHALMQWQNSSKWHPLPRYVRNAKYCVGPSTDSRRDTRTAVPAIHTRMEEQLHGLI